MGKFKVYCVDFSTNKRFNGADVSVKRSARLDTDMHYDSFSLSDIVNFQKDLRKIIALARKSTKDGDYFELSVSVGVYDRDDAGAGSAFKSVDFDTWEFSGVNEYDAEGVYLQPDERYTDASHDMWIDFKSNVFEQIAEYTRR